MCTYVTQPRLPLGGTFPAHRVFDLAIDPSAPNPRGDFQADPLWHALVAQGVPPGMAANVH